MAQHVIVVGAGITGVSAALWLRRAGTEVTLIDRVEPGDTAQTSYGNGGILARCAVVPVATPGILVKAPRMLLDPGQPLFLKWRYLPRLLPWLMPYLMNSRRTKVERIVAALAPLTGDSVEQHLAISEGTAARGFISTGEYIYLYRSRADYLHDGLAMALRRAQGFVPEERTGAVLREDDPGLSPAYGFGAVFGEHGWITDPGGYVAALFAGFRAAGGSYRRAEVVDVADGAVTLAGGERLTAAKVVLAAGVWSRRLAERLGHRVMMESERGYHLELRGASHCPSVPYMVADAKFVVTPMATGLRCAGIVELGGTAAAPSSAPIRLLRRRIGELYPDLSWESEEVWMGHRPSTCDSLPMLGASPKAPGVVFAFGSQHIGLTIGPRLGRMAAEIALERHPNIDIAPYAVDRFDR